MTAQLLFRAVRDSPLVLVAVIAISPAAPPGELPWIRVADNSSGFVAGPAARPFTPWGFNYDHDAKGRLIEDYWHDDWSMVEAHFAQGHWRRDPARLAGAARESDRAPRCERKSPLGRRNGLPI